MLPKDPLVAARRAVEGTFSDYLSIERVAPYQADAESFGVAPLDLYIYNMALASSLLGPINLAETVMRNAVQKRLAEHFGCDAWWDAPELTLSDYHYGCLEVAHKKLAKSLEQKGRGEQAGDVVAALEFGFWQGLLGEGPDGYNFERELWQPALQYAFPNNRRPLKGFRQLVDGVRRLRNRVSHHEPLYRDRDRTEARYRDTLLLVAAVSTDLSRWVDACGTAKVRLALDPSEWHTLRF